MKKMKMKIKSNSRENQPREISTIIFNNLKDFNYLFYIIIIIGYINMLFLFNSFYLIESPTEVRISIFEENLPIKIN